MDDFSRCCLVRFCMRFLFMFVGGMCWERYLSCTSVVGNAHFSFPWDALVCDVVTLCVGTGLRAPTTTCFIRRVPSIRTLLSVFPRSHIETLTLVFWSFSVFVVRFLFPSLFLRLLLLWSTSSLMDCARGSLILSPEILGSLLSRPRICPAWNKSVGDELPTTVLVKCRVPPRLLFSHRRSLAKGFARDACMCLCG